MVNKPGSATACCPRCGASLSTAQSVCRSCSAHAPADVAAPPALHSTDASLPPAEKQLAAGPLEAELVDVGPPHAAESSPADATDRKANDKVRRNEQFQRVINSRWLVICVLFGVGPFGLPALWYSPCFTTAGKVFWGTLSMLITTILPAIAIYYLVKLMIIPLCQQIYSMF